MKLFKHNQPKVGLALGSGAARGLAHIGVLKVLKEAGIHVDLVVGTSMGAMIGACFAKDGEVTTVERIALKTTRKELAHLLDPKFGSLRKGLIHGQRVEELLRSLLGRLEFKDMEIPFAAVTTDINTGEEIVITKGPVLEAVRASIAIPGIFVPATLEGKCLVDGGLIDPMPVDILRDMGAKFVIAVNVITELQERRPTGRHRKGSEFESLTPNIFNNLIQSIHIMEYEIIKARMPRADIIISPDTSHINAFDFYKGEEAITTGYKAAINALPKLQKLISKQ